MTMSKRNKRKKFFANDMQREIFLTVFWAALAPTLITVIVLFYLIFNITADQVGIPEAIASTIYPAAQRVVIILLIGIPFVVPVILVLAFKISHRIVGPFDRIVRELDECVKGTRKGPIHLRKDDKFRPLVDRINALLRK